MARPILWLWLLCFVLLGVGSAQGAAPSECQTLKSTRGERFELGLAIETIVPSGLPDLTASLPLYGVVMGWPIFGGTIELRGGIGGAPSTSLYLAEATYRFDIPSPFLNTFLLLGAHYLTYTVTSVPATHDGFGANTGLGFSFPLSKSLEVSLGLRVYLQSRSMMTFGGGLSFLL